MAVRRVYWNISRPLAIIACRSVGAATVRERQFRRLWIVRINAACRMRDMRYSEFMHGLQLAMVSLDRKSLSEIAIHDPAAFDQLVEIARKAIPAK